MAPAAEYAKRGAANRDTGRRFGQWARNPEWEANAVSAILKVAMVDVAVRGGLDPTMGQSPFALQRSQCFERHLFPDDARIPRAELRKLGFCPKPPKDLRTPECVTSAKTCRDLDEARPHTLKSDSFSEQEGYRPGGPTLVAGATICVPGHAR
jgi:hypothetical protein